MVQKIARAREINKAHTTFIDTILKHSHKGRIHAEINQLRSDVGGTVIDLNITIQTSNKFLHVTRNLDHRLDLYLFPKKDIHGDALLLSAGTKACSSLCL